MTDIAEGVALDQDLETGTTGGATPDHCLDPDLARQGTQEEETSTGGRILDLSHGPDQIHPTRGIAMRETDQGLKRDQDLEIGHIQDLEIGHTQDLETDPVPDHMIQDLINLDLVL